MALKELEFPIPIVSPPTDFKSLIDEANDRIEHFVRGRGERPLVGFVPSDFHEVYSAILAISKDRMGSFVEWGSGFGVATLIAAKLGFDAGGIEIQPDLVDQAERLAEDFEIDAEFVCGSYVPPESQDVIDNADGPEWLEPGGQDGHGFLDVDPEDIDVVFAYPWPGETEVIEELFGRITSPGALLLTWNGLDGMRVMLHLSECA
ncbi:MAG: hypothetical protein ACI97A_000994 [Planctomycetota bacterium]|jgi:hypothetical protein